jgi:hypothetical protein
LKCTRCRRNVANPEVVAGMAFGPTCIQKVRRALETSEPPWPAADPRQNDLLEYITERAGVPP